MQRMTRFVGPNRSAAVRRPPTIQEIGQLRRLGTFIRPYRRYFAIAMVGVVVASGLGLVFPRITGTLVDTALAGIHPPGSLANRRHRRAAARRLRCPGGV